ncbi:hypothetical protein GCM10007170_24670 [Arthrobacter liuii]|uniref:Uncharacterized protein n=1 Tax=Arthrobacter liuii TaxID=1476996 RepID=A0ABQ2ASA1_9MICC|nr:hypothetical protein GCM10007170_24670 [Arthrobacter liuii]
MLDDDRARDAVLTRAEAGQGCHHQPVGKFKLAEGEWGKQHAQSFRRLKTYCLCQLWGTCNYSGLPLGAMGLTLSFSALDLD